jgi:hypothetical protein
MRGTTTTTTTTTHDAPAFDPFMRIAPSGPELGTGATTFAGFTPMNDQPGLADRKAMFVLAASGMLLSTLLFLAPKLHTLLKPQATSLLMLAAVLAVVTLVTLAGRCAYAAYSMAVQPASGGNVMFVQNVAGITLDQFEREVRSHAAEDALMHTLEYNHTMARLGFAKFRLVGRALGCLRIALPIWMLLLLVLGLKP